MSKKGYSQHDEDLFVYEFFNKKNEGFLIDIGAADGKTGSNSKFLIEMGWSAILVEPNHNQIHKLNEMYQNNNKVKIENFACSDVNENNVKFYVDNVDGYDLASSLDLDWAKKIEEIYNKKYTISECNVIKTSDLIENNGVKKINFLSIDTEGFDNNVIKGINFDLCDIDLICIETLTEETEKILSDKFEIIYETESNIILKNKKI